MLDFCYKKHHNPYELKLFLQYRQWKSNQGYIFKRQYNKNLPGRYAEAFYVFSRMNKINSLYIRISSRSPTYQSLEFHSFK